MPPLEPMLASLKDAPLDDPALVYEPKYDGIRAIVEVTGGHARLWSRLGNDKSRQFPEVIAAFEAWARTHRTPVILDGEIVALDEKGEPAGFQQLQERLHLKGIVPPGPAAFIAFDMLREGRTDLRRLPLVERRRTLARVFGKTRSPLLRMSVMVRGDGRALYAEAVTRGWEGLIAKRADSRYRSGKRSPDWRKLKILHEQEFVIGGWTEPRQSRSHFGALLLGVCEPAADPRPRASGAGPQAAGRPRTSGSRPVGTSLIYAGHVGTGFDERELGRLMALLKPLEIKESPFAKQPAANERAHWVQPRLVAQVKFTEWTADGNLRHPVYLGLRDDKAPTEVRREEGRRVPRSGFRVQSSTHAEPRTRNRDSGTQNPEPRTRNQEPGTADLLAQLHALEAGRRDGVLTLPDGQRLNVTNLHKVFWPVPNLTKGDLFRYYVQVAPFLLPLLADRPLVLKRYPNGVTGKWFYQHRAPDDAPKGVRVEEIETDRPQIVGGDLITLLFTTQLAALSQDPFCSRVGHFEHADHVALDLDPPAGAPFARVLDVARWIRDELDAIGATGAPKTSGAEGLHIYIPLPPGTAYDAGRLFCQIVATIVARKHPKAATLERSIRARGTRVYVDCLQNGAGKTLASAYSARASEFAGVSTPVTWQEVDQGMERRDFTITSVPGRLEKTGDLWAALRSSKGVDLSKVIRYAKKV